MDPGETGCSLGVSLCISGASGKRGGSPPKLHSVPSLLSADFALLKSPSSSSPSSLPQIVALAQLVLICDCQPGPKRVAQKSGRLVSKRQCSPHAWEVCLCICVKGQDEERRGRALRPPFCLGHSGGDGAGSLTHAWTAPGLLGGKHLPGVGNHKESQRNHRGKRNLLPQAPLPLSQLHEGLGCKNQGWGGVKNQGWFR